ncbi:MAG: serine/threonine protein phosphatase [Candidatus Solibacter sp.]|nr:serine/threonine protein phosphatase [Candidatus Solibacter sp.]
MPPGRSSRVKFRERAELLDFLLEVSTLTSETLDLDELLESVADIVRRVIPHELFAILLYSERRKGLRIRYARGHREEIVENLTVGLGEGITGTSAQLRQPLLVEDVDRDPRYLNAMDAVRSEMAVPMMARQQLVGVLDLQATTAKAFSEQDVALLQLIASRIATAIENARLYRRVDRQNRIRKTLAHLAHEFSSILDLDALLSKIADSVKGLIDYDAFLVLLVDEKGRRLVERFSRRYDEKAALGSLPLDAGLTGAAARTGKPVLARDTLADSRYVEAYPGIRSEIAFPLILNHRVVGVMDLESERVGAFTEDHVRTLSLIAPQIAAAIENARLYQELAERERETQKDLVAAQKLQSIIFPTEAPTIPGLDVGVQLKPARLVSGDLYDFFEYDDGSTMLAFGDSSGKGAAAALYGALFSGLLRSLAPRRRSPAALLRTLNENLMERQVPAQYVTLLAMLWQSRERVFKIANAGSAPPLVCRGGEVLRPEVSGVPVGLLDNMEYEETEFEAQHGDVVLLYSDGISDQQDESGEDYGRRKLKRVLSACCEMSAQEIADRIIEDLEAFRGPLPVHDDQTLVVLKVK